MVVFPPSPGICISASIDQLMCRWSWSFSSVCTATHSSAGFSWGPVDLHRLPFQSAVRQYQFLSPQCSTVLYVGQIILIYLLRIRDLACSAESVQSLKSKHFFLRINCVQNFFFFVCFSSIFFTLQICHWRTSDNWLNSFFMASKFVYPLSDRRCNNKTTNKI